MNTHQILHLSANAGKIILENGGETYRVEDTILRLCSAFGVQNAESYVTPTGIMISITDGDGNTTSLIKRIRNRTIDLDKISRINDLSRAAQLHLLTPEDFEKELQLIQSASRYNNTITILFSALAAGFFTLLFGGTIKDFIISLLIGALIKSFSISMNRIGINDFFINTLGGAMSALVALISVKLGIAQNVDKIIIGSIMLLVPGLAITNAIRDTISGDLVAGVSRAVEAFFIAVAIAAGSGIILKIWISIFGGAML